MTREQRKRNTRKNIVAAITFYGILAAALVVPGIIETIF